MTMRWTHKCSVFVLAMGICLATSRAQAADEEQAVKDATMGFYAALNTLFTGELDPMKEVWSHAEDVTYMGPTGGMQVGWDEVLVEWESQAVRKLGGSVKPGAMRIFVGPHLAVAQNYEMGSNTNVEGTTLTVSIRATNLFRKENGKWKMIGHHTDILPGLKQ